MGHWEDTYGAACEVWELETCSGVLVLLSSGHCFPTPDVARRFLVIGKSCHLPPHCFGYPVSACVGQGDSAVPVVLPTLSKNTLGNGAVQPAPCLTADSPGRSGKSSSNSHAAVCILTLLLRGVREKRGVA